MKDSRKKLKKDTASTSQNAPNKKTNSKSKKSLNQNTSLPKNVIYPDKIPKLVKVLWVDAMTIGGAEWLGKEEAKSSAKEPLPMMLTVGFVLHNDEEQISLTSTIGPGETAQVNKIPKRMVIKIEEV